MVSKRILSRQKLTQIEKKTSFSLFPPPTSLYLSLSLSLRNPPEMLYDEGPLGEVTQGVGSNLISPNPPPSTSCKEVPSIECGGQTHRLCKEERRVWRKSSRTGLFAHRTISTVLLTCPEQQKAEQIITPQIPA